MRHASFASKAPVVHAVIGLAIFVQADVPEPQLRRLQPPANSVKSFYNGLATGAAPPVTTVALTTSIGPPSVAQAGASTTAGWPILKGVSDRNKAIITGVAAGAGLSAVAGGIAIAVQQLTHKEKEEKEKAKRGISRKSQAMAAMMHTTTLLAAAPPPKISTTGHIRARVAPPGDEIPMPVWIILAILCSCCVLTLVAALATQFSRGDRKRAKNSKKRSATIQPAKDRDLSRDSEGRDDSMYSSYSSEYSRYPSQYSQASLEYERLPTGASALSSTPDVNFDYGLEGYSPVSTPLTNNGLENYLAITSAGAGNWQARPSSFDPYSYAREENTYGGNVIPGGYDRRGASIDSYGRQVAQTSSNGGSAHSGRQQAAQFNDVPYTRVNPHYDVRQTRNPQYDVPQTHVNPHYDVPQTRVNPHYAAAPYTRNEMYPEEVYSGYM